MPEFQVWVREYRGDMKPNPEREQGFGMTIWIRHFCLGIIVSTPKMWAQMSNIMQYLEDAGVVPNNVKASSSRPAPA